MPIFEYACRRCGKKFENLQLTTGGPQSVAVHKDCGGVGELVASLPFVPSDDFGPVNKWEKQHEGPSPASRDFKDNQGKAW